MRFNHDICIISPGSNKISDNNTRQWITKFSKNIEVILQRYLTKKVDLISFSVNGSKKSDGWKGVAVYLVLLSEQFLADNDYSKFLTGVFNDINKSGDSGLQGGLRFIKILISELEVKSAFDFLPGTPGIPFFSIDNEGTGAKILAEDDFAYWSKMLDLAHSVSEVLSDLSTSPESLKTESKRVFLATTSPDLVEFREDLRRELIQYGYRVDPQIDLQYSQKLQSDIDPLLERAALSIHMLGTRYGQIPPGTDKSLPEFQMDLVTEYIEKLMEKKEVDESKSIDRLIWIQPEAIPEDERQEKLINQLKQNIELLHRTEIVQVPLELFKTIVVKRLKQRYDEMEIVHSEGKKERKLVYIIHEKKDEQSTDKIVKTFNAAGVNTVRINFDERQKNLINVHKDYLIHCDAAFIYYGSHNRAWLQSKVKDILKAPGYGRKYPMQAKGLLIGGEDSLENVKLPEDLIVLKNHQTIQSLDSFLKKLK